MGAVAWGFSLVGQEQVKGQKSKVKSKSFDRHSLSRGGNGSDGGTSYF
jgi:hypothetical protein